MRQIKARFASKCAETNKKIAKGESMIYEPNTKQCFCMDSSTAKIFLAGNYKSDDEKYVDAQENAYFDNFLNNNNI